MNLATEFHPYPKSKQLTKTRKNPRRGEQGKFSAKTIQAIFERDGGRCVRCGSHYVESVPHHVVYKSQLGKGTVDNGVVICRPCHQWAHGLRKGPDGEPASEGREWFERYREERLMNNG